MANAQSFPAHRGVVVAHHGMVAASQPLAVSAGLQVLQSGGTFIDAAITVSSVLNVTEPYNSHLGGDAFVIVYDAKSRSTLAFNGSGAAPALANPSRFLQGIPLRGLASASVPGLVDMWFTLHEQYGSFPIETLLAPAISYADEGFPAGYRYAMILSGTLQNTKESWVAPLMKTLTGSDDIPKPGQQILQPDLAWTLQTIAVNGRDAFYDGEITEKIVAFSQSHGGLFSREDFARHRTQVSEPLKTDYRGYTIHGQPPVSQGHILLQELNLIEGFDMSGLGWGSADALHVMVEAKKLAFADRAAYLGDPNFVEVPMQSLLSKEYAARRRGEIDLQRAAVSVQAGEVWHDTTYFCVADEHGNAVSFIQSIFHGFGCGIIAEGTGILFNNRMTGFSLEPSSPNYLVPGKRTAHTLNAYLITKGDQLAWVGGTPGGDVQVQSNLQVISNVIDYGMNPQQAVEAPRWQHHQAPGTADGGILEIEDRIPADTIAELTRRGHQVRAIGPWAHGSAYQLIAVDEETNAYMGGSDPRTDGHAAGY
jgi:gamma-glutamyltranspeptidase/glutathione hydrolase